MNDLLRSNRANKAYNIFTLIFLAFMQNILDMKTHWITGSKYFLIIYYYHITTLKLILCNNYDSRIQKLILFENKIIKKKLCNRHFCNLVQLLIL